MKIHCNDFITLKHWFLLECIKEVERVTGLKHIHFATQLIKEGKNVQNEYDNLVPEHLKSKNWPQSKDFEIEYENRYKKLTPIETLKIKYIKKYQLSLF